MPRLRPRARNPKAPARPCAPVRALTILVALLLAGCAGGGEPATTTTPSAASTPTTPSTPAAASPAATSPAAPTESTFTPGVVYERRFDYLGNKEEIRDNFTVPTGANLIRFTVTTGGKPVDGSFQNAVMDVYAPGFTSPMFAELPGQEAAKTYTLNHTAGHPWWGKWMVRYAGQGMTSVELSVSVE